MSQEHSLRIIDANVNRAREALRVMEEYARLVLDDRTLSSSIKDVRHEFAAAVRDLERRLQTAVTRKTEATEECGSDLRSAADPALARCDGETDNADRSVLARSRDINGDVGCDVVGRMESNRRGADQVLLIAGKRLGEALRCVEEYGKVVDAAFAGAVEQIRYRGYELERRLQITHSARLRLAGVRLYVIITECLCAGDWFATVESALLGGADCIQLREKNIPDGELLVRARRVAGICRESGAMFFVNDRPDIAVLSGADGVHVGQDDLPVLAARRILGPGGLVGVSTHCVSQVEASARHCPDYIAVGPMFRTSTKSQAATAGTNTLTEARRSTSLPLVAIGGIGLDNVEAVIAAASCSICVCSAVIAAPDPQGAVRALKERMLRTDCQTLS